MNRCSASLAQAYARRQRARRGLAPGARRDDAGRAQRLLAEARGDTVHGPREPLAAERGRLEQRELARPPPARATTRTARSAGPVAERLAIEQSAGAAIDHEAVLGGIVGVAARDRGEVGEPELEGDAAPPRSRPRAARAPRARPARAGWRQALGVATVAARTSPRRPSTWAARTARPRGRRARRPDPAARRRPVPNRATRNAARHGGELADRRDAHGLERLPPSPPHAPEAGDRQRRQEVGLGARGAPPRARPASRDPRRPSPRTCWRPRRRRR